MNIAIISGSARSSRQSHQVALEVQNRLAKLNISAWMWDVKESNLPLLVDVFSKQDHPSEELKRLKSQLDLTDGFIIISPEYNGSYSGALKNSMDYFFKEYEHKYFGIITVSAGNFGGINALKNLQHYVLKLNGYLMPEFLLTPNVQKLFEDQLLIDESYALRLDQFLNKYISFSKSIE